MARILIIKHGAFGDVIQCDGALRDIRAHHPQDEITVLTTPPYRRIFARSPHVNHVLTDPRAPRWRLDLMYGLRKTLRQQKFDMVYDLQNSGRTRQYYRWFLKGTPWSGTAKGCSHPHRAPNPRALPALPRLASQLRDAGLKVTHTEKPDVSWMADDMSAHLEKAGVRGGYIVLVPGCSASHPEKRWPYYDDLARRLMAAGHTVLTVPGPDELTEAETFPGIVIKTPQGYANWFELAGVLKGASFVIGNDTGPSHIASHLGVPGLALFGPGIAPIQTSLPRENFPALQVPDLKALDLNTVLNAVESRIR